MFSDGRQWHKSIYRKKCKDSDYYQLLIDDGDDLYTTVGLYSQRLNEFIFAGTDRDNPQIVLDVVGYAELLSPNLTVIDRPLLPRKR